MTIATFKLEGPASRHASYSDGCAMFPVAPEYTAGDVLLASLFRVLVLGMHDQSIDLALLAKLPEKMDDEPAWRYILEHALKAPPKLRSNFADVIPIVPRLGAHAAVLGAPRNRWLPGRLAAAAIGADSDGDARALLSYIADVLRVGGEDDLAARFLESALAARDDAATRDPPLLADPPASFWRRDKSGPLTPGERLARDLRALAAVKPSLPRYQWDVLVQAILRLGVASYQLWLCMLHEYLWDALVEVVDRGAESPSAEYIERAWCTAHADAHPLLELDENATDAIRAQVSRYAVARTGINLVLHALEDAKMPWQGKLGTASNGQSPAEATAAFVAHVAANRAAISAALSAEGWSESLLRAGQVFADTAPIYVYGGKGASTNNLIEFLRHVLGQASRKAGDYEAVDQAYFTRAKSRFPGAPQFVQPGPTMLVALAVSASRAGADIPASMQDLGTHLRDYGIYAPLGTLSDGEVGRQLEELGLTVETPDAGGGRLLVNPFASTRGAS